MARAGCLVALASVLLLLAACPGSEPTRVRIDVQYPDGWGLTRFQVDIGGKTSSTAPVAKLELLVADDLAAAPVAVQVIGFRDDELFASGAAQVQPRRGETVTVAVVLSCGVGCTEGDTRCSGDAVVTCEQNASDHCMEWSAPQACPDGEPSCSLGTCSASCTDECTVDDLQCAGPAAVQSCGYSDSDDCTDWHEAVSCDPGQTCFEGACSGSCNKCPFNGAVDCQGDAVVTCNDADGDSCLEWTTPQPCDGGLSCVAGECIGDNALAVALEGTGTGVVLSGPEGINCPGDCSHSFAESTQVTLVAAAELGSLFAGWSGGGCSGKGSCLVTVGNEPTTVTATFVPEQYRLTVVKAGAGDGTISSSPGGISCGDTCVADFDVNTEVTLTAAAAPGSCFDGWSGAGCSGAGTCSVVVAEEAEVTVNFISAQGSQLFEFTGTSQSFTVPECITSVTIQAWGGEGGAGGVASRSPGGRGGYAEGTLAVTPGETLQVVVGAKGEDGRGTTSEYSTYGGGGGGGSSYIGGVIDGRSSSDERAGDGQVIISWGP